MAAPLHRLANSIATRLVLVGVLVVVSGSLLRYFLLTTWLREDMQAMVSGQRLAAASFVASAIDYKLHERQTLLQRMAKTLPMDRPERTGDMQATLSANQTLVPLFSEGLTVLDPEGVVIATDPPAPGRIGRHMAGDTLFEAARKGNVAISTPGRDGDGAEPALSMATPIRDRTGAVRGVLVGRVSLVSLELFSVPQSGRGTATDGLLLISPLDNLFVWSSDPTMIMRPGPARGVNLLHDRALDGYRGTGITVNAKGVEELSAIVSVPTTGWFVVSRIPTAEAFAAITLAKTYMVRTGVGTVVAVFLLVMGVTWWALKPLFDAARQADAMTLGDAPLQPLPVVRNDEVGHLTASFNRLLSKLANTQAELQSMAHHDSLTGLPNRRLLADRLVQALARARRDQTCLAMLVMDLDGFKRINDSLGHAAGDEALRVCAERFASGLRGTDTLARVGGDEFVLLASDLPCAPADAAKAAQAIAAKCIAIASKPLLIHGAEASLGVSIGIALGGGQSMPEEMTKAADRAMYEAKQAGRGCYVLAGRVDVGAAAIRNRAN